MSEPNPTPQPQPVADPPAPTPPPSGDEDVKIPKARFDEVNDRMKKAEAEAERLRKAQAEADEKRLEDEKKFEDLATKRASERDEWKGKAEEATGRIAALEQRLHAIADARVTELPEKLRERVPAADKAAAEARLEKIEELLAVLAELPTPSVPRGNAPAPKAVGPAGTAEADARAMIEQARALRF
jgi:small-conductance mechanosensitive channel